MKEGIHPKYFEGVKIRCACGHEFIAGSTVDEIKTELCSACHPFYTGKQKLVDTAGRVDKFRARLESAKKKEQERVLNAAKKVIEPAEKLVKAATALEELNEAVISAKPAAAKKTPASTVKSKTSTRKEVSESMAVKKKKKVAKKPAKKAKKVKKAKKAKKRK